MPSNPLVYGVVSNIASLSRHKLLSTLSSMRRRDPQENGIVTVYDAKDVFELHDINFDEQTKFSLLEQFMVLNGMIDYKKMWKFVMGMLS